MPFKANCHCTGPDRMKKPITLLVVVLGLFLAAHHPAAYGQGYGTDTQNVLTPAAGGMAGVSVAAPQDVPAAVFGNPSTLAQFHGTQFTLGGAWVEGYPTVTQTPLEGAPYRVTSRTQGFETPDVALIQDLRPVGLPGTFGLGLGGLSGLGAEYRGRAPEGTLLNNVSSEYMVLGLNMAAAFELTDRLSAGAALTLGTAFEQLGFVGPLSSSAMVHDYALRGTFGLDYDLNPCNTVGVFYQTRMDFQFPNAVRFTNPISQTTTYNNLNVDQPQTVGFGLANRSLISGDLLIAADVYYKLWEDAALWQDVLVNQWVFAVGTQLTRGRMKYRLGYSYNTNPVNHSVGDNLDGFPVLQENVLLFQASSTALINQHRLTGGVGCQGFLFPSVDLDIFAGGMFKSRDDFGPESQASVALYYIGMGLTWRYGA
jgi:long-chain fatty acid transport protein